MFSLKNKHSSNSITSQKTSIFRHFPHNKIPPSIPPISNNPSPQPNNNENVMTWGKPTWFLFHTLAEKVIESRFLEIRAGLLDVVYSICLNLPCPKCAEHAKAHLNAINFNKIRTKEDFKMLFFDFHNYVNSKKGYAIYKYEELNKYETAITKNIIYNFFIEYNAKSRNVKYLADDLHRQRLSSSLKKWFNNHLSYFAN